MGRYALLFPIAKGGMGEVYAATATGAANFAKLVAVKTIRPELVTEKRFIERFKNEARLAANITSPHVVSTHDFGIAKDGTLYLAMDFVLGVSLSELFLAAAKDIEAQPWPVLLHILLHVVQGLADAHQATDATGAPLGLVHRDLSPHNVIVGVDGRARIVDFGVARAVQGDSMTQTGEVVGKLGYLSPEQLRGMPVDQRCDIFAFGIVAWELLSGKRLFRGESTGETMYKLLQAPITPLTEMRLDVPPAVAALVGRCLDRDADARPASAQFIADALRTAVQQSTGLAPVAEIGAWVQRLGERRVVRLRTALQAAQDGVPVVERKAKVTPAHGLGPADDMTASTPLLAAPHEQDGTRTGHGSATPTQVEGAGRRPEASLLQTQGGTGGTGVTVRTLFTLASSLWTVVLCQYARPRWWLPRLAWVLLAVAGITAAVALPGRWRGRDQASREKDSAAVKARPRAALRTVISDGRLETAPVTQDPADGAQRATDEAKDAPYASPASSRRARSSRPRASTARRPAVHDAPTERLPATTAAPADASPPAAPSRTVVHLEPKPAHRWLRDVDSFDQETTSASP
ncbi:MAG: serine/threonine-protein kinase [Polyangiales bacterium]